MTESSPDVAPLIDLTLHDVDAQGLVEQALVDAATKLPDWVMRESNTEVVLLETQALMGAEIIYAVNRLPQALLAALLARYGLTVDPGQAAAATVQFTSSAVADVVVPAGTRLRVVYDGGEASMDFLTVADTLVPAGGTGTVSAAAELPSAALNGTPAGPVELADAVSGIDSAAFTTPISGGTDPEGQEAYLRRGSMLLRRLVSTLVLPEHFEAAALTYPQVARAKTVDLYDPAAVGGAPGDHPGHVTVAVAGAGGLALDGAVKALLASDLESKAHAALKIHVIDPTVTAVPVTVEIVTQAGHDPAAVQAAVVAAVGAYLDPAQWGWAGTVYRNELISLIDQVVGVDRVANLAAPAADVSLAGVAALADAGAVTVTVV